MLVPDISKCWVLFLISALLSLALQKSDSFSEIRRENALCVAGFVVAISRRNASRYVCHEPKATCRDISYIKNLETFEMLLSLEKITLLVDFNAYLLHVFNTDLYRIYYSVYTWCPHVGISFLDMYKKLVGH